MLRLMALAGAVLAAGAAQAADASAGKTRFQAECGLCHSAEPGDGGGGMGPALHGLMGRPAGSADPNFPYSPALRSARLIWDAPTLDRYLADPGATAPGTVMPLSVPDKAARDDLIAYFASLKPTPSRP